MKSQAKSYMHMQFFKPRSYFKNLKMYPHPTNIIISGISKVAVIFPIFALSDSLNYYVLASRNCLDI